MKHLFTGKKIVLITIVSSLLFVIGCGNASNKGENTEEDTRQIKTELGEVKVSKSPKRVIAQYITGDVLALGIEPVGMSEVYDSAAYEDKVKDVKDLGQWAEWDEEEMMDLDPDLILTIDKSSYERFSKIAPTVYVPYGEMTTTERVTFIGDVLNKSSQAEKVLKEYNDNIIDSQKKLKDVGFDQSTVSIFEGGLKEMMVIGQKFGTGLVAYDNLKLIAPEKIQKEVLDKDEFTVSLSLEVLPEYAGDYIIRNTYDGMDNMNDSAIWKALPAIENKHLIEIPFGLSYYTDILSANAQIDFIRDQLIEKATTN
ncbi:hypothetical protein CYV26_04525 [Carnobacterium maltaromaticum]|uniref:ABC transporter substrate-binding protein n=1 Tax=Carnobacterium maltaromaticum TaxID=2751 RepID=UPI000C77108C|nr:ABC transporter substrate-binding protein [Carnobacterium maltaromaticum]PLS38003.1 hypothetical protein CYV33_01990 [Carnobacterium maltaromaticum]PLS38380.1 hypothetical protein CYV31_04515 [Carnobacterium maltaromaticum]PLS38757.1 hypothetical protein CYV30_01985 [Carnobacterium maltaromaticum]PLS45027.1 hypothetical protein CYV28_01985 [Carnobacterium maltaromaticum]PLS47884.1 hypothetical protein CYV27_00030 [Carnobacterium maltaromaticum]